MADFTIIINPLYANLATRQFASHVFYLRATDQGDFFIVEHSIGMSSNQPTQIGKQPKGIIVDRYIDHLEKNGVQILNLPEAKQEVLDAIEKVCSQYNIPFV